MDFYTLTKSFIPREIVGEFVSAVWTERYSSAGDVELVTPATPSMVRKLTPGTFLGLRGTKEIMMLDTQSIENDLLTTSGVSLPKFLDERVAWFSNPDTSGTGLFAEYTSDTLTAGQLISSAVEKMVANPVIFPPTFININLDWTRDKIPGLQLGVVDGNGDPKRMSIPIGPLYTSIQQLAEHEGVGIKLYLVSSKFSTGYVLKFATYRGKDRTSQQTANQLVRLTPKMDSLTDVKELTSQSQYKNVIYVFYNNEVTIHYAEPTLPIPEGFNRRVLMVQAENIYLDADHIAAYEEQTARNAIANNNYVMAVDGQVSPQIDYKFNVDYGLGDIIELEGLTGLLSKARVTEYIRSQDKFGEREYPTLSVIDPINADFMPDTEPNPDFDTDFDGDPDVDFDIEDSIDFDKPYEPPTADFGDEFDPNKHGTDNKGDDPNPNPDPNPDFGPDETGGGGGGRDLTPASGFPNLAYGEFSKPEGSGFRFGVFVKGDGHDSNIYNVYWEVNKAGTWSPDTEAEVIMSMSNSQAFGAGGDQLILYDPVVYRWLGFYRGEVDESAPDSANVPLEYLVSADGEEWFSVYTNHIASTDFEPEYGVAINPQEGGDTYTIYTLRCGTADVLPEHPEDPKLWASWGALDGKTPADAPFTLTNVNVHYEYVTAP
jgi:hypothetical protein